MTINKSPGPGQSLGTVGSYILKPVSANGQFYVAASRGTNWRKVKILINQSDDRKTVNVVYPEVIKL